MNLRPVYSKLARFATLVLLSSCTVYAPMQPTISTVRAKGQSEISASVQPNGRVEAGGVYSPLPHALIMATGTFRPKLDDTTFAATRQWEVGVGSYLPLGRNWLATGMVGYGYAVSSKRFTELPLVFWGGGGTSRTEYQTRYGKVFGQVGVTRDTRRGSFGVVYRLSKIDFDQLNYSSAYARYAIPLRSMVRHEALLFGRHSIGSAERWQLQGTLGLSMASGPEQDDSQNRRLYEANRTRLPMPLASLGIVFRPQLLRQQ